MTTILVPYHHDERLPDARFPLHADTVVECGLPGGDLWQRMAPLLDATAEAVAEIAGGAGGAGGAGTRLTVVSGDCLVAGATVAGVQRAGIDPGIVWFDAHGDVHTLQTTTSGYLGGLSLRLVTGSHPEVYASPLGLRPLPEARAVLVDGRDLDPAEAEFLAGSDLRRLPVQEVDGGSVPAGPLVVHVDLDVIDPEDLPGLLFPAPGGPSAAAVLAACDRLEATGRVVAWDLACTWHTPPTHDFMSGFIR